MTYILKGIEIPDRMFIQAFKDLFSQREREDIIRAHLDRYCEGHEREEWLLGMLMSADPLGNIAEEIATEMGSEWDRYHVMVQRDILFYRGDA